MSSSRTEQIAPEGAPEAMTTHPWVVEQDPDFTIHDNDVGHYAVVAAAHLYRLRGPQRLKWAEAIDEGYRVGSFGSRELAGFLAAVANGTATTSAGSHAELFSIESYGVTFDGDNIGRLSDASLGDRFLAAIEPTHIEACRRWQKEHNAAMAAQSMQQTREDPVAMAVFDLLSSFHAQGELENYDASLEQGGVAFLENVILCTAPPSVSPEDCETARERLATIVPLLEEAISTAREVYEAFPMEKDCPDECLDAVFEHRTQAEPLWLYLRHAAGSLCKGKDSGSLTCSLEYLRRECATTQAKLDKRFRKEVEEREAMTRN